ncbi:unnamed protein product [Penicillium camemberti]|uniref:Str. FM013 n=1 Tax=Penicillium camemberti (strain FM 013) TaxID=1429867 RepID=A0A0G4PIX0_PENC3|nr:unnamed protein product [Penicillium camemberti]
MTLLFLPAKIIFLVTTVFHTYQTTPTKTWFFVPFCIGGVCCLMPTHSISASWDTVG